MLLDFCWVCRKGSEHAANYPLDVKMQVKKKVQLKSEPACRWSCRKSRSSCLGSLVSIISAGCVTSSCALLPNIIPSLLSKQLSRTQRPLLLLLLLLRLLLLLPLSVSQQQRFTCSFAIIRQVSISFESTACIIRIPFRIFWRNCIHAIAQGMMLRTITCSSTASYVMHGCGCQCMAFSSLVKPKAESVRRFAARRQGPRLPSPGPIYSILIVTIQ